MGDIETPGDRSFFSLGEDVGLAVGFAVSSGVGLGEDFLCFRSDGEGEAVAVGEGVGVSVGVAVGEGLAKDFFPRLLFGEGDGDGELVASGVGDGDSLSSAAALCVRR